MIGRAFCGGWLQMAMGCVSAGDIEPAMPPAATECPDELRFRHRFKGRGPDMRKCLIIAAAAASMTISSANAQVDLSTYADAEGFLNVQALTCAQLANTWQEDADRLAT
jgi:hypothetical protein